MCSTQFTFRLFSSRLPLNNGYRCRYFSRCNPHNVSATTSLHKTFEPDYLDAAKHLPEKYKPVNIQMRGPSFEVLEKYQKFVHNLVENLGIDCSGSWATPNTSKLAKNYAYGTTKVKDVYEVHTYERNVQVSNMLSGDAPILIDILRRTLPEGVELSVHEHLQEHFEARYIPDPFILGLHAELDEIEKRRTSDKEQREITRQAKEAAREKAKLEALYQGDEDDDE